MGSRNATLLVRAWRSFLLCHEVAYESRDVIGSRIQRKMAAIHNVNLSAWHILPVGFRLRGIERRLILTPDHQQAWLLFAHPRLPFRVRIHIGSVVIEEIALYLSLA